jgi:ABC-2 type transport system permease protein
MGALATLAVLNYVGGLWQDIAFVRDITYWLSISGRATWFLAGLFSTEDFLYFIIVMALFLVLATQRLQSARQKSRWTASLWKYAGMISVAMLLGYATSRPMLKAYYDATSTKINTLTASSQKVISELKGGLTITTYTNMLDDNHLWIAIPRAVNVDLDRFKQYQRFKPGMKIKYVYYYDTINNPGLAARYPRLTDEQRVEKILDIYDMKKSLVRSPEEIRKDIDLSGEGNVFVRSIKRESGEQTFLRVFDDQMQLPGETEITAALKRLTMHLPKVGFLQGHGERDNHREGDRNYKRFAQDKPFRYALINQGFDVTDVTLEQEVRGDINIIVIADMKNGLSAVEKTNLDKYIARGGNMLIAGDTKRQHAMDELVEPLGVRFVPGTLVHPPGDFQADFTISKPTKEADSLSYIYQNMHKRKLVVTMPGAVGLEYTKDKGFDVTPLFRADSATWNEVETTDFIDDTARLHPAAGEVQKPYATGLALSRKAGEKMQKIIILGDADCISNGEISIARNGVQAANYSVITGAFYWMSDNEVPIDVRRPPLPDDRILLDKKSMATTKLLLMWVFPATLALCAIVLWIRRRGR